jgi:hypothetical protein
MRWAGHVAYMDRRGMHTGIWWQYQKEGRIPQETPTRTWEENIMTDLGEIGWGGEDWINLAKDRDQWRALINTVMKLWVP